LATLDHAADDAARDVELRLQVDGDAEVPLGLGEVGEVGEVLVHALDHHAGVVDQHVDAPEAALDPRDHGADLVHPGEVGGVRGHFEAEATKLIRTAVHALGDVDDGEQGALFAQHPCRVEPDAVGLGDPGDQGDLALHPAFARHVPLPCPRHGRVPAGVDRYRDAMPPAAPVPWPDPRVVQEGVILPNLPSMALGMGVLFKILA
jgi:hypothetical protein